MKAKEKYGGAYDRLTDLVRGIGQLLGLRVDMMLADRGIGHA